MLQQTRVEAVKPYYERFLCALPDVASLASVPEDQLMKLWEGLGYYNRARNLQKAAQKIMNELDGQIPASFETLATLPGIGAYTAGAIASIAFGISVPAVDGNVLRVISRILASRQDITAQKVKQELSADLSLILPPKRVGDFNQALMELGAIVCLPNGEPLCANCPLNALCLAHRNRLTSEIPVKAAKKKRRVENRTVFVILSKNKAALQKREQKGLLSGLWEFPNTIGHLSMQEATQFLHGCGIDPIRVTQLPESKHIFTHVEWHMTAYLVLSESSSEQFTWCAHDDLTQEYALPSALKAYLKTALENLN